MVGIVPLKCVEDPLDVSLDEMFVLGQVSLVFSPARGTTIKHNSSGVAQIRVKVSLRVGGRPVFSETLRERCNVTASVHKRQPTQTMSSSAAHLDGNDQAGGWNNVDSVIQKSYQAEELYWTICARLSVKCEFFSNETLVVLCRLSGDAVTDTWYSIQVLNFCCSKNDDKIIQ